MQAFLHDVATIILNIGIHEAEVHSSHLAQLFILTTIIVSLFGLSNIFYK